MPVKTATFIADLDIDYPSDYGGSSTASLAWAAIQDIKRSALTTLPKVATAGPVLASVQELHSLRGLGGQRISVLLSNLSATFTTQKLGRNATAVAMVEWDGALKYIQSDTPEAAVDNDLWFQI